MPDRRAADAERAHRFAVVPLLLPPALSPPPPLAPRAILRDNSAMLYLIAKAAISGILIAIASEVARRFPGWGALIVSLPLVSILAMLWLWRDTRDPVRLADHAEATFWFVLPSLPLFLIVPAMLRAGVDFRLALLAGCAVTIGLYLAMIAIAPRFGIRL